MAKMNEMPQSKIREDVDGAPHGIGRTVRIVFARDETFDKRFMGKIGEIVHYCYSCGCGQSFPDDPMIGVQFKSGKIEEFWSDEMKDLEGT